MKKTLLLFFILSITATGSIFAQTLTINATQSKLFPDTCDSGAYQSLQFHINYTGPYLYNETIVINYRVKNSKTDSSIHSLSDSIIVPRLSSIDSITIDTTVQIKQPNGFFVTNDIVVIWPTGSGGIPMVGDSVLDTVLVLPDTVAGINGIKLIYNSPLITLYPNPGNTVLYLSNNSAKNNLEYVRIYNLFGQMVLQKNTLLNTIDISSLAQGEYFIEVSTSDRNQYVYQFVKSQ